MATILIIDDDTDICNLLEKHFIRVGNEVAHVTTGKRALLYVKENPVDLIFCDYRLPDINGKEFILALRNIEASIPVIIITGYSDVKVAVDVIKCGAFDFIVKPLVPEELTLLALRALAFKQEAKEQKEEEETLLDEPAIKLYKTYNLNGSEKLVNGISPESKKIQAQISLVAPTNYSVIIYGESGTGKESVAYSIHKQSRRRDKPFVAVDCGSLTKELAASELFGHEKGSFTGAIQAKTGQFELANGGTIFLDEIANLSYDIQVSLLRAVQERKIRRVGSQKETAIDVRIIVAANENLKEAITKGKFREDLYHRFNEFSIDLPPLRDRKEDILLFVDFFITKTNAELDKNISGIDGDTEKIFMNYAWPGNLREMNNVIKRACLLTETDKITALSLPAEMILETVAGNEAMNSEIGSDKFNFRDSSDLKTVAQRAEYERIIRVLRDVNFNKAKAARILNIDRKTLYNKLNHFDFSLSHF